MKFELSKVKPVFHYYFTTESGRKGEGERDGAACDGTPYPNIHSGTAPGYLTDGQGGGLSASSHIKNLSTLRIYWGKFVYILCSSRPKCFDEQTLFGSDKTDTVWSGLS